MPRVHHDLLEAGYEASLSTVGRSLACLLARDGLRARRRPRLVPATTNSNHDERIAPDALKRDFRMFEPNTVWVGDITYMGLQVGRKWAYLATVINLYSRRIVGWALSGTMKSTLCTDALGNAFRLRGDPTGVIVHHDRGVWYACNDHAEVLRRHGATLSMSRKGNCWDNAVAERFFATLKRELGASFASRRDAHRRVANDIDWCNAKRRHSHNNGLSPKRAELAYAKAKVASPTGPPWVSRITVPLRVQQDRSPLHPTHRRATRAQTWPHRLLPDRVAANASFEQFSRLSACGEKACHFVHGHSRVECSYLLGRPRYPIIHHLT